MTNGAVSNDRIAETSDAAAIITGDAIVNRGVAQSEDGQC
jgi:hypothetical protein